MSDFPYSPSPTRLVDFLSKIQTIGVPDQISLKFLISLGFKSNSDRYNPGILKSLGFTDSSNVPTERWKSYRSKAQAPNIMSEAIKEAYPSLFSLYPDAYRKDDEAINNFFTSQTTVGQKAVVFMVRTFKELCSLANFEESTDTPPPEKLHVPTPTLKEPHRTPEKVHVNTLESPHGVTLNINIQLTLPETKDGTIYDKIFESLRKNLIEH
ncbi:DUF5343 domain-containing protein [Chloroflexota bacterium]